MKTNYTRVLPGDLFNEAKLLKCIGRLVLLIEDRESITGLTFQFDDAPFNIVQDPSDGSIAIHNIRFKIGKTYVFFASGLNSKSNYPLFCVDSLDFVFNEEGDYTKEFITYCNTLKTANGITNP